MGTFFKIFLIIALVILLGPVILKIIGLILRFSGQGLEWLAGILDWLGFTGLINGWLGL